ncbi:MAG: (d)CMP kinase [Acutalibacteraceae bacterium]|nr:(d)CMP kinase [Acutalibacteraceae bacterium]
MEKTIAIAIDGPAGAGKSSLARTVANRLNFIYVDTGALYRSIGLAFLRNGIDTELNCNVEEELSKISIDIKFIDGVQHVFLNGEDVSEEIRTPKASMMASSVSAVPAVRAFLLDMQREFAEKYNVIMDGRDIGTVVLPDAQVKIFLTASDEERASRRFKELKEKGSNVTFEEVLRDMRERDYNDSHRAIAPLKPANDSVIADTTGLTIEESIELLMKIIKEKTL